MRARSQEERQRYSDDVFAWFRRMRDEGRYVSASRLVDEPGQLVGPSGEVKPGPPLAAGRTATGYIIIRARDDAEAAEIAKACPISSIDSIVVRRVR